MQATKNTDKEISRIIIIETVEKLQIMSPQPASC